MSASRDRLVVTPFQLFRRTPVLLAFVLACNSDEPVGPRSQPQARLRIGAVSPTELKGTVARVVQPTPSIVVLDQANKPLSGVKVNFTLSPQNSAGSVLFETVVTNSNGIASAGEWVLGKYAVPQTLGAWIEEEPAASITFTASALPDSAAHLRSYIWIDSTMALPNDTVEVSSWVVDRFGNGVAGVLVTYTVTEGGGSLAQTHGHADQRGEVRLPWILGSKVGLNAITMSTAGLNAAVRTVQTISLDRPTFFDLEEIAGGLPHMSFVETGFIALEDSGGFLDSYTGTRGYELEGVWRSTGRYEVSGSKLSLIYPTMTEEVGISGDYLLVSRFSPNGYGCCVIWTYRKRNAS